VQGDPAVSGLLPIFLGDSTKASVEAHSCPKEYICVVRLHGEASDREVEWALSQFLGEIYQTPPVRSNVARRTRIRTIYELELLERDRRDLLLRMAVSGGTYIRKICHDLGLLLGTGAHMYELRRTRIAEKTEREAVRIQDVQKAEWLKRDAGREEELKKIVSPIEDFLSFLPRIEVLDTAVDAICHGAPLAMPGVARIEEGITAGSRVGIFTLKGEIVAVALALKSTDDALREGGIIARTDRVYLPRGAYPPYWKKRRPKMS
jgi:predicted rRNA pseudouridine synthase